MSPCAFQFSKTRTHTHIYTHPRSRARLHIYKDRIQNTYAVLVRNTGCEGLFFCSGNGVWAVAKINNVSGDNKLNLRPKFVNNACC